MTNVFIKQAIDNIKQAIRTSATDGSDTGVFNISDVELLLRIATEETPSSFWSEYGKPDFHAGVYDGDRAKLTLGFMTDDELANGVYLHGNRLQSTQELISSAISPLGWLAAAKERIHWLSRALERALEDK
jgi:hypothetical protein